MDIYESLRKQAKQKIEMKVEEFSVFATRYAEQGFDKESVAELLQIDGCDVDLSKKISEAIIDKLPLNYCSENPPESFADTKGQIENSINSSEYVDDLEQYIQMFADQRFQNVPKQARVACAIQSKSINKEIVAELEPLVNEIIFTNNALANDKKFASSQPDEKEQAEQNLFGIWPVSLLKHKAEVDKADKKLLKKTEIRPGDNISFI